MVDSVAAVSRRCSEESTGTQQLLDSGSGSTSSPSRMSQYMDNSSDNAAIGAGAIPTGHETNSNERYDNILPPHLRMVQQLLDRLSLLPQNNFSRFQHASDNGQSDNATDTPSDSSSVSATARGFASGEAHQPLTSSNITFTLSRPSDRRHSFDQAVDTDQSGDFANDAGRSNSTTGIPSYAAATLARDKPPTYEFATSRTPSPTNSPNPRRIIAASKTFIRRSLFLEVQQAC